MLLQQGDLLLRRCLLPNCLQEVKPSENGRFILAEGEATGHTHSVAADGVNLFRGDDGKLYIGIKSDAIIEHQEHEPITIPAGTYEVGIVNEYDHFLEESRKVRD